jgi:hypothetical protein
MEKQERLKRLKSVKSPDKKSTGECFLQVMFSNSEYSDQSYSQLVNFAELNPNQTKVTAYTRQWAHSNQPI